jgi:hypothetical protein
LFALGTYHNLVVALGDFLFDTIDIVIPRLCSSIFPRAMSAKPEVPDAWDADWESQADVSLITLRCPVSEELLLRTPILAFWALRLRSRYFYIDMLDVQKLGDSPTPPSDKKVSSKVTKAQRRAQQAEFNRQLWAEAYVLNLCIFLGDLQPLS